MRAAGQGETHLAWAIFAAVAIGGDAETGGGLEAVGSLRYEAERAWNRLPGSASLGDFDPDASLYARRGLLTPYTGVARGRSLETRRGLRV